MKQDSFEAMKHGEVVKHQIFTTDRGVYQVTLIRYRDDIFFFKHRNGKLTECCNLSKMKLEKM